MGHIKFDFNNMFSHSVGKSDGVTEPELAGMESAIDKAHGHIQALIADPRNRISLGLEWTKLPFQDKEAVSGIQKLGDEIASSYENVIFLGIGGSYLGLKAAQDALRPPYYNEFSSERNGRPKIYFEGNNLDPDTLSVLLNNLDPKKTFVVVISKSGETTETKAAFAITEVWLKKGVGKRYGRQVFAITDSESGTLRNKVRNEQAKDKESFRNLPVSRGVGGRFSELNIGLLHLAIVGIDINEVTGGGRAMAKRCASRDIFKNPANMYAALNTILYRKKNKSIAVLMPFSETLKPTADWYVQLLAESLGKKYSRKVIKRADGSEIWEAERMVNTGRTPIPARGTGDLHSIQQNNIEGENNKVVTFIRVEKFKRDLEVPVLSDILSGRRYSRLLSLAQVATEWALAAEARPNCAIIMPEITPFHWGELIFFFEMATAFEGELLNVNAFDQPGVEGYKNYLYYKLGKPGIPKEVKDAIENNPLKKSEKFIF